MSQLLDVFCAFHQSRCLLQSPLPTSHIPGSYYRDIISQLSQIGLDNLISIDDDMRRATLQYLDSLQRSHLISIQFSTDFPLSSPTVQTQLPLQFTFNWTSAEPLQQNDRRFQQNESGQKKAPALSLSSLPSFSSLESIYKHFGSLVSSLEPFFFVLSDFNTHTHILEPIPFSLSSPSIRIEGGKAWSLVIDLLPLSPYSPPSLRLMGSESIVAPLRVALSEILTRPNECWNMTLLPRLNLERILNVQFPLPPANGDQAGKSRVSGESGVADCAICYSFDYEGTKPSIYCNNPSCARVYHRSCLDEWLSSLPGPRSLGVLRGGCAYCSNEMVLDTRQE